MHDGILLSLAMLDKAPLVRFLNNFACIIKWLFEFVIDNVCDVYTPYVEIRGGLSRGVTDIE